MQQFSPSPVADQFMLAEPNKSWNKQTNHNLLLLIAVACITVVWSKIPLEVMLLYWISARLWLSLALGLQPRTYGWITALLIFSTTALPLLWYCLNIKKHISRSFLLISSPMSRVFGHNAPRSQPSINNIDTRSIIILQKGFARWIWLWSESTIFSGHCI